MTRFPGEGVRCRWKFTGKMDLLKVEQDRQKWNKKYSENSYDSEISQIVKRYYSYAPKGQALDIAAGMGQNSFFLSEKGFTVDAVDISDYAIENIRHENSSINTIEADLDTFVIEPEHYEFIINIKFLQRRLFPYIKEGLKKHGLLIFESYIETEDMNLKRPYSRDYLLRKNELLHSFLSLRIIYYCEEKTEPSPGEIIYKASLAGLKQG
jgi:tellurite methyltransferase